MQNKRIMIMAGGTGGHIFPGLALAASLQKSGDTVQWLGAHGLETKLVPEHGISLNSLSMKGVRGNGLLGYFKAPFMLFAAILEARKILKQFKPDYVVGFGGFAAAPGGFAAKSLGIPLIIHEQNAVAGLTNKLLAHISQHIFSGFPCNLPRCVVVGNPVRAAFFALESPEIRYRKRGNQPLNILIMGGSQGARKLNTLLPPAIDHVIKNTPLNLNIWHQTGAKLYDEAEKSWQKVELEPFKIAPFIDDVVAAYAWADLVICRSGASTVSELAAGGVASILIPFPAAVDDHQTANARYLSDEKAAILLNESDMSAEALAHIIENLSRAQCLEMAQKAHSLAHTEAISAIEGVIARC